jgi:protein CpxP
MYQKDIIIMASILMLSSGVASAGNIPVNSIYELDAFFFESQPRNPMFDGVELTEQQRQQMRDLMYQARKDFSRSNLEQMETMHHLITAERFDPVSVRAETQKMTQEQVERQVELTQIRHQMYHLLTAKQRAILEDKYQQRLQQLQQKLINQQSQPSLQLNIE